MQKSKVMSSKNIAARVQALVLEGKTEVAEKILQHPSIQALLPHIHVTLKKQEQKKREYAKTKIYSATPVEEVLLEEIEKKLNQDLKNREVIIDSHLSPGIKIKKGDLVVDATLSVMLERELNKLLTT